MTEARTLSALWIGWAAAVLLSLSALTPARAAGAPERWIATWAASPQVGLPGPEGAPPSLSGGSTVRERMRVTLGGKRLRIRFSNELGAAPLVIGAASLGLPTDLATVAAGSMRKITFGGRASVTIPAGAPMLSDPVDLDVASGALVTISLYTPQPVPSPTLHLLGLRTAVITPPGDFTGQLHVETASTTTAALLVTAILVPAPPRAGLLVAFGDSITDGNNSTLDGDRNWPDDFSRWLAARPSGARPMAIVGEAISGNQLLRDGAGVSALARFDRDVLSLPGVTDMVVLEGINDLGWPGARMGERMLADPADLPTAQDLIIAYRQLIDRAHSHGIRVTGATLTPWEGTDLPGYYSDAKEEVRQQVNAWIRTGGAFDRVVDFDKALRDPARPSRILAPLASFDHLHPSDAGYQALSDALAAAQAGGAGE